MPVASWRALSVWDNRAESEHLHPLLKKREKDEGRWFNADWMAGGNKQGKGCCCRTSWWVILTKNVHPCSEIKILPRNNETCGKKKDDEISKRKKKSLRLFSPIYSLRVCVCMTLNFPPLSSDIMTRSTAQHTVPTAGSHTLTHTGDKEQKGRGVKAGGEASSSGCLQHMRRQRGGGTPDGHVIIIKYISYHPDCHDGQGCWYQEDEEDDDGG